MTQYCTQVSIKLILLTCAVCLVLGTALSNKAHAASQTPYSETEKQITALKSSLKRVIDGAVLNKLTPALFLPNKAEPFSVNITLHFAPTGEILNVEAKVTAKTAAFQPNLEREMDI